MHALQAMSHIEVPVSDCLASSPNSEKVGCDRALHRFSDLEFGRSGGTANHALLHGLRNTLRKPCKCVPESSANVLGMRAPRDPG